MTERPQGIRLVIYIGSDHAGFRLKESLRTYLVDRGHQVHDEGTHSLDSCDYPVLARQVCNHVVDEQGAIGILICGTGLGMSITANRMPGIRAALCLNEYLATMARRHNNANVLCLGERVMGVGLAQSVAEAFLQAEFEGGRHLRRVELIESGGRSSA